MGRYYWPDGWVPIQAMRVIRNDPQHQAKSLAAVDNVSTDGRRPQYATIIIVNLLEQSSVPEFNMDAIPNYMTQ